MTFLVATKQMFHIFNYLGPPRHPLPASFIYTIINRPDGSAHGVQVLANERFCLFIYMLADFLPERREYIIHSHHD